MAARINGDVETTKTSLPVNDAWTGMLAVSLAALSVACVLLYLDYSQYSGQGTNDPKQFQQATIEAPPGGKADEGDEGGKKGAPEPGPQGNEGAKKGL